MIPASFDYVRPSSLEEALTLLAASDDAKLLAGGHSLIPAMKLRLAQPQTLIDLARVADLNYIRDLGGKLAIGGMTTHAEIEHSPLLALQCPLLPETAGQIGDVQVRNRGTIGGSLVHADPASDWPAAILALQAELEVAGPAGRRTIPAARFFVDIMQTALKPLEILVEIRVPATAKSAAYVKAAQKASGFAVAGVAVVIDAAANTVAVGVTGVAAKPYRARAVENALKGGPMSTELIEKAARKAAQRVEPLSDIHASAAYRANLARVNTRRALELALQRAG